MNTKAFFRLNLLSNRYPALHGLRVLALLLVVQHHVTHEFANFGWPLLSTPANRVSRFTFYGMDLFFFLSGFLIGSILIASMDRLSDAAGFARFYIRRSFRIFPLYFAALGLLILALGVTPVQRHNLWHEVFFLTNYPFRWDYLIYWSWSLSVEEHFYVLAPFIILLLGRIGSLRGRLWALGLLWLSGLFVRLWITSGRSHWSPDDYAVAVFSPSHTRYDLLFAGIFLAYCQLHYSSRIASLLERKRWVNRAFAAVPVLILAFISWPDKPWPQWWWWYSVSLGTLSGIAYFLLFLWILNYESWASRFLSSRIFLWAASLSYSVYLLHLALLEHVMRPALHAIYRPGSGFHPLHWWGAFFSVLALSFLGAYALHLLIEKPALLIRDRWFP